MRGEKFIKRLLEHSKRAYIAAIDTYNQIGAVCRVEGFCFYMTNAWELLLKARMIQETGDVKFIYYKKDKDGNVKTKSIDDCKKYVFQNELDPVRKNIEWISELRNEAVHYMISELESIYISYFQASAINYSNYIKKWFNIDINEEYDFPILSLFTLATNKIIDVSKLKGKYDKQVIDFVIRMQNQDKAIRTSNIDNSKAQLYVPIEYKAAIVRNPKNADILLTKDGGTNGLLTVEVPRDPEKTHPYLFHDIKERLDSEFESDCFPSKKRSFQPHDAKCITTINHFADNNLYAHKQNNPVVWRYTDKYIEFVIKQIKNNSQYLYEMREKYRRMNKSK